MPRSCVRGDAVDDRCCVETWVCLPEICAARPRAATSIASVAMKGTSRPYEMSTPLTRPTPMPTTSAVKIMPAGAVALRGQRGAPDAGQRDDRADRQVDAAADDHEGHADRDHADRGGLLQDGEDVVPHPGRVAVEVGPGDDADDDQRDQHADQAEVAAHAARRRRSATSRARSLRSRRRAPPGPGGGCVGSSPARAGVAVAVAVVVASCRRTFHQRPRHDEVEHGVFVELAGGRLADDPALAHDQHPVGQAEHLGHLAGDQQHPDAAARPGRGSPGRARPGRRRRRRGWARRAAAAGCRRAASGPTTTFCWLPPESVRTGRRTSRGRSSSARRSASAAARSLPASVKPAGA